VNPSPEEQARRDQVFASILDAVRRDERIKLPPFDASLSEPGVTALHSVGIEPNAFGGTVGEYRYQFEGEEDLLHLIVTRRDGGLLRPEEGQQVTTFLLPEVSPAVIWLKPGTVTQHFYVGHDELLPSG
jgi:hypothetical protein